MTTAQLAEVEKYTDWEIIQLVKAIFDVDGPEDKNYHLVFRKLRGQITRDLDDDRWSSWVAQLALTTDFEALARTRQSVRQETRSEFIYQGVIQRAREMIGL